MLVFAFRVLILSALMSVSLGQHFDGIASTVAEAAPAKSKAKTRKPASPKSTPGTRTESKSESKSETKSELKQGFTQVGAQPVPFSMGPGNKGSAFDTTPRGSLKTIKESAINGNFDSCLSGIAKAKRDAKALEPWISNLELQCAMRIKYPASLTSSAPNGVVGTRAFADRLQRALDAVDRNTQWLSMGPWAKTLKDNYVAAHLLALEWDTKFNRNRAWQHVEKLSLLMSSTDEATRARYYRLAGDFSFVQQKIDAAKEFYRRSLVEQDQADLRDKLRALEGGNIDFGSSGPTIGAEKKPEGSDDENELFSRITNSIKAGDLVASVEDAVKFLGQYPGSARAKWVSDRALDSLVSVTDRSLEKQGEKFLPVKDSILKAIGPLAKSDPERVAEWMRVLYNKGHWPETARLARLVIEGPGQRSTKNVDLAMEALYAVEDWKGVQLAAEILLEKHAGTSSSRSALFRLGLLAYRENDDTKAIANLEKLVSMSGLSEGLEIQSRYWLWRSLSRSKSERAQAQADELMKRFPFSYYGLRARIELTGAKLEWPRDTLKLEVVHWLSGEEKLAWDRAKILIANRWFDEAQEEIKLLPNVSSPLFSPEAKAIRASILAGAKSYPQAARMANQAWDVKFDLRRMELMRAAFPDEYKSVFEVAAKTKGVDALLTRSLTKQESSYNPRALSTSNAMGLMQMIPPTAREIGDEMKLGKLNLPDDLFDPSRNIPMGTHYVAKMLRTFKGHVPLALAAYNAGPTRLDRWLKSRPTLKGLETTRSSAPEFEVWIDELPYAETSQYVKAILRNMMLYRVIEEENPVSGVEAPNTPAPIDVADPLWKSVSSNARP